MKTVQRAARPERLSVRFLPFSLAAGAVGIVLASCGSSSSSSTLGQPGNAPAPVFTNPTAITNSYLPLASLNQDVLEGAEDGEAVRVERTRKEETRTFTVNGKSVAAMIVEDREIVDGELAEVTLDYFAQSDDGTVYYLGEDVDNYEDGQIVNHDGSWLFGVQTQDLNVIMPAQPKVGDKYQPENAPGIAREDAEVVSVSETITVPAGTFTNVLKVKETHPEGEIEFKYYAPNVGVVKEEPEDGEVNLISHR